MSKYLAVANDCPRFATWLATLDPEYRNFAQEQFKRYTRMSFPYLRIGTLPIDFVLQNAGKDVMTSYGILVKCSSWRVKLFATKGIICSHCGISGNIFALERRQECQGGFHLNLYHVHSNGLETLMTVDHIIPKSKGGGNTLSNLQPMCFTCNMQKADSMPSNVQVA